MSQAAPKFRPRGYTKPTYARSRTAAYGRQAWKDYSPLYRRAHPLCVECLANGITKASELVDHIEPLPDEQDPSFYDKFWDEQNQQALCWSCHNKKTVRETQAGLNRRRF